MLIGLHIIIYGRFCIITTEMSSCDRDHIWSTKLNYLVACPLQKKFADPWLRELGMVCGDRLQFDIRKSRRTENTEKLTFG